jgi:hypothetical protein
MENNLTQRQRKPTPPSDASELVDAISIDNLASAAHTSRQTLYDAMNSGDLPSFKLGGRRYIRLSTWRAFCAMRETSTPTPKASRAPRKAAA